MKKTTTTKVYLKYEKFLSSRRQRIEKLLAKCLKKTTLGAPKRLIQAMNYSVLDGGKRLRALLVYVVGEAYNIDIKVLDPLACAIELIHAFSLVHDDLPAMDDDKLRRGKPTCHIAFDEATAILVGDALAIAAFAVINQSNLPAEKKVLFSSILTEASGACGMTAGQSIDIDAIGRKPSLKKMEEMYLLKTGFLIRAAIRFGALAADAVRKADLKYLDQLALNVGLAFQIQDDILNINGNAAKLGKNIGTDKARDKNTYPEIVGIEAAKLKIKHLWGDSLAILGRLNFSNDYLQYFIDQIIHRDF